MMITCRELTELVTEYVEGRMSFVDRTRFQVHLGTCKGCRAYVRQMKATIGMLGALGKQEPPALAPEVESEMLERFRGWKKKSSS